MLGKYLTFGISILEFYINFISRRETMGGIESVELGKKSDTDLKASSRDLGFRI